MPFERSQGFKCLKACLTVDVSIFQFFPMYALGVIEDFLTVFIEKMNILRDFS